MAKVIQNLVATSYESPVSYTSGGYLIKGNIKADAEKRLTYVNGLITKNGENVGSFDGTRRPGSIQTDDLQVGLRDVTSSQLQAVGTAVDAMISAVKNELAAQVLSTE